MEHSNLFRRQEARVHQDEGRLAVANLRLLGLGAPLQLHRRPHDVHWVLWLSLAVRKSKKEKPAVGRQGRTRDVPTLQYCKLRL